MNNAIDAVGPEERPGHDGGRRCLEGAIGGPRREHGARAYARAGRTRAGLVLASFGLALLTGCGGSTAGSGAGGAPGGATTAPRIASLTATTGTANGVLTSGGGAAVSWTLAGGAVSRLVLDHGVGDVTGRTSVTVTPATTTSYTLTATNAAGSDSATVTVTVGVHAAAIEAFQAHALAIDPAGQAVAWGADGYGQLGDGTVATARWTAVPVRAGAGLGTVQAVAAGLSFSLALDPGGSAWGWGYDSIYQLGNNDMTDQHAPVPVDATSGPSVVVALSAGEYHGLALDAGGAVWAWGGNPNHELGTTGSWAAVPVPVDTSTGLASAVAVAAGYGDSFAIDGSGVVWGWGANGSGQLGDGTTTAATSPQPVPDPFNRLPAIVAVSPGVEHTVALGADGTVWAWGQGGNGQLGNGSTRSSYTPVPVQFPAGASPVVAIAAGGRFTVALEQDGTVWGWGDNTADQLGPNGSIFATSPVSIPGVDGVVAVAAGYATAYALRSDGSVWAWGANDQGQLGNGDTAGANSLTPTQVLTTP